MSGWTAKRFWSDATVVPEADGYSVRLDQRQVRTPGKQPLILPTRAMAEAVAAEWQAQDGVIRPDTMPCTRAANSALEKVMPQFDAVVDEIANYGGTDLLCYRAEGPAALARRQSEGWDPLLVWASAALDAPLRTTRGIMPVSQPVGSLARLRTHVASFTSFQLVALHDLVAISGSLILGLAVTRGRLTESEAWTLSRIDETWQAEQWGEDDEAAAAEALRAADFRQAGRFYRLCG
jgi:chaperone required for assembly of F1-ATPase